MMCEKSRRLTRLLFLLCLGLGGCAGGANPVALYLLDAASVSPTTASDTPTAVPTLVVNPVSVAPFLDNGGIVYQVNPNRVVVARDNQWAAPLSRQLTDSLYATLTNDMTKIRILDVNTPAPQPAYRLTTQVERFQGLYSGVAAIEGTWQLFNPNDKRIARQHFEIEVPLRGDGYLELVHSLSRGWRKISEGMVDPIIDALAVPTGRVSRGP